MSVTSDTLRDLVGTAAIEEIASGCGFTEGPVWIPGAGYLLFSDIAKNRLMRWDPRDGANIAHEPNNRGNGMTLDDEGRLIVCEHLTSHVSRQTQGFEREPIATHYDGRELNSPNDVIVASDGSVIFTDPSFGRIIEALGLLRDIEQPHHGVYRIAPGASEPELLVADMGQPNGLCLTRDEKTLLVGDTVKAHIRRFEMGPGAPLRGAGLFAEGISASPAHDDGYVDGMKIDELGNVYVTGPGGIWVYDEAGQRLGTIEVPQQPANLNWGDDDWRTLYITAQTSVYRLPMNVGGHRLGYMR